MTKQTAGVTGIPAQSERMTGAVWIGVLAVALVGLQIVAYKRALRHTFAAGYWRGRSDENQLIVAVHAGEFEDNFGVALEIRNQIADALGEAEAQHWVEHHLEFVPDLESGESHEWGETQT